MKYNDNGIFQEQYENGSLTVAVDERVIRASVDGQESVTVHYPDEIMISDLMELKERLKLI